MSDLNDQRRIALLESTLREILRIDREAEADKAGGSVPLDTALDGSLLRRWRNIRRKAESLVGSP